MGAGGGRQACRALAERGRAMTVPAGAAGPGSGPALPRASAPAPRNRLTAAARIEAVAGPDGTTRLPVLSSQAPLVLRRTPSAVYLVGGAAGPIGGDELSLWITVGSVPVSQGESTASRISYPPERCPRSRGFTPRHILRKQRARRRPSMTPHEEFVAGYIEAVSRSCTT